MVTRSKKLCLGGEPRNLLAFTGTLRTMPREINVGYVIAMPKFTRILKAVGKKQNESSRSRLHNEGVKAQKPTKLFMQLLSQTSSFRTKKQACHPTEVGPGDVCKWANVLHMCKIQDDRHEANENKVGASNDAEKECSLSKFGTSQDHLEEHLRRRRQRGRECTKSAEERYWRGRTCQAPVMSLARGRCCVFITLGSTDSSAVETRALSKYGYLSCKLLDRNITVQGQQINAHISLASVSWVSYFIISSCLLLPGYIIRREPVQDFLYKTRLCHVLLFLNFLVCCKCKCHYRGGLLK